MVVFLIPGGIQQAGCALIGSKIGAGKVQEAKELESIYNKFSIFVNCLELTLLYLIGDNLILLFTTDKSVMSRTNNLMMVMIIVIALDFQQGALYGSLKALG